MKTTIIMFLLFAGCSACDDTERTACEIYADATCAVQTRCDGGILDECRAYAAMWCESAAPSNDTVSAYACEEAYSELTCREWRHGTRPACHVLDWKESP